MRLLHVINSTAPAGGGPIESIRQLTAQLVERGHESEIVCCDPPEAKWLDDSSQSNCPIHALGPAVSPYRYTSRFKPWLAQNLSRFDAAIVHSAWQHPGHALSRLSHARRFPYFVYPHGSLDPQHRQVFWKKHWPKALAWRLVEHRFFERARGILYTCDAERELATRAFRPALSHRNACVVPYCTGEPPGDPNQQRSAFQAQHPELSNRPFLLFLSRIHPKKGVDLLLQAFAQSLGDLQDYLLVIAGPGEDNYVEQMRGLAAQLGIAKRVRWPGMLSGDLKWGAFRSADAFVLCSHQENFGIAVVEALACQLPVLITDRINISDVVARCQSGLVGTNSAASCAEQLRTWGRMPIVARNEQRSNARKCFELEFRADRAAEQLLATFRKLGVKGV